MDAITRIVGSDHVKRFPADLEAAGRATVPEPRLPAAVVYPGTAEDVSAVVRVAGEHRIALWVCSKGKNWGYGSATAVSGNTVILHLERLDRIIEVN